MHAAEEVGTETSRPIVVSLIEDGYLTNYETRTHTVGEFIDEHVPHVAPEDFVSYARNEPLEDGMRIIYRHAIPVVLEVDGTQRNVLTASPTVAGILSEQRVALGRHDLVFPSLGAYPDTNDLIRVVRVSVWTARVHERIAPIVRHRYDTSLAFGKTATLDAGVPGMREIVLRFTRRDNGHIDKTVLASRVLRQGRPKIVVHGIGEFAAFEAFADNGVRNALRFAGEAVHMVATAYTPDCCGGGLTKLGLRAGHGVVAVDPNVIPLGTRLYVPGYGTAIAGDTGGAIRGHRIDLGFNSYGDAMRFGRRSITIYVLH